MASPHSMSTTPSVVEHLGQPEVEGLAQLIEAVHVEVVDRQAAALVHVDEREGRAGDPLGHAEPGTEALDERRLAGAEVTREHDHVAGPSQRRKRAAPAPGLVDGRRSGRSGARRASLRGRVATFDPSTDRAHHLVGDRVRGACAHSSGVIRSSPWVAEQHGLVAGVHVAVGADVDHELIHRDRAHHRVAAAPDEHLLAARARVGAGRRRRSRSGSVAMLVSRSSGGGGRRRCPSPAVTCFTNDTSVARCTAGCRSHGVLQRGRGGDAVRRRCRSERGRTGWRDAAIAAAELATWRIGTSMPASLSAARAASYRSTWRGGEPSSGSSATAQWVHTAARLERRVGRRSSAASATASLGATPTRRIPVSTLRCTGHGPPPLRPATARRAGRPGSASTR